MTFHYYLGRTQLYNEAIAEADDHLTRALRQCRAGAVGHKRKILRYLVPVSGVDEEEEFFLGGCSVEGALCVVLCCVLCCASAPTKKTKN